MRICQKCHSPINKQEIQCPQCGIVLGQLYCNYCNEPLDLRYGYCLSCHQPYSLPYKHSYEMRPLVSRRTNKRVDHARHSSVQNDSEDHPSHVFDIRNAKGDTAHADIKKSKPPKGCRLFFWSLNPKNGKSFKALPTKDKAKFYFMLLLVCIVLLAGFGFSMEISSRIRDQKSREEFQSQISENQILESATVVPVSSMQTINVSEDINDNSSGENNLPYYLSPNANSDLGMAFSKDIDSFVLKYNTEIFNIRISSSFSGIDYETIQFLKIDSSSLIGGNDIEQTDMGNYIKSYFYVYDGAISTIAFTVEPLSNDITSVLCGIADASNQYQIAFAQLVTSCILATVTDLSIDDADYFLQKAASVKIEDPTCVPFYLNTAISFLDTGYLIAPVSNEVKLTMNYHDIAID